MTMKFLCLIIFLLNCTICCYAQTIEEIEKNFWEGVSNQNNNEVVSNGELLMAYIKSENYPTDSITVEIRLYTALAYSNIGNTSRSLSLNLETYEICKTKWGETNFYNSLVLNNLGLNYYTIEDYKQSIDYLLKAIFLLEKMNNKEHPIYVTCINSLALAYTSMEDFKKASDYSQRAIDIHKLKYHEQHPDFANCLNNIALNYYHQGEFIKSIEYNLEALTIQEKVFGKDNEPYALYLNNIGMNYFSLGNYSKSNDYLFEGLSIIEKLSGKEHPDYAICLNNIALNYHSLSQYVKSLECNNEVLDIYTKLSRITQPAFAKSLNNISLNYSELGEYKRALEYSLKALKIYKITLGEEHSDYTTCLNNIGLYYSQLGDFGRALEYFYTNLKIYNNSLGKNHPQYSICLNNIAECYMEVGDYQMALPYLKEALKILEFTVGKDHPNYAMVSNNIGLYYSNTGDYNQSIRYNKQSLLLYKKKFGKNNPDFASCLRDIASNYAELNDFKKALKFGLKALRITKKALGCDHPDYALNLSNIAFYYSNLNNFDKALEFNLAAIQKRSLSLGTDHPDYGTSMSNTAFNYADLKQYNKAIEYFILSTSTTINNFKRNLEWLPNKNVLYLKMEIEQDLKYLSSLSCLTKSGQQEIYDFWAEINGFLNSNFTSLKDDIDRTNDTVQIVLLNKLSICELQRNKFDEMGFEKGELEYKNLEIQISELQTELIKRSKIYSDLYRKIDFEHVRKLISEGEVLVDIYRFPFYDFSRMNWTDSVKYLVFVSNPSDTIIDHFFINEGKELEGEIQFNYKTETSNKSRVTDLKNEIFFNSFWKPIAEKIGDAKTIYVSLGGVYNNINLNTLYNPETGKYLIEEKDIRIVNSARDFVLNKERDKKQYTSTTSALYGFPDFNGNATKTVDSTDFLASTRDLGQMWIDSLTRGGMKASPLPATKAEVEQIAGTFQKNGWKVSTYTGENATETNIKKEVSPRVLHVATHGYFFEDIPLDTNDNRFLGMDRQRVVQDPMLRSGLLFTGANKTLQGEEAKGENGLLSAAEASLLDLSETELVVLSACETGKGEVKNSEGVYGLRKAFSYAGADNIIMSLWKVDDKVTKEFMTRFYEIWLNEKTTIREAFNRTQLEIKKKYPQPYYWGAFILVGE
jgi:CHAT domain-containing protein/tetratricopeptide (TPR) repeat protein